MEDVWLHIFSRFHPTELLQLEVVSKHWKSHIGEVIRRRQALDLEKDFPGCVQEPESMRQVIERHGPALTEVVIRVKPKTERFSVFVSEHHLTRTVIQALIVKASRLRKLRIERMNLTIGAVEEIAFLPETLQELSIINCSLSCDNAEICLIAQNSFRTVFQRCQKLKKFEITWRGYCFENFELTDFLVSHIPDSIEELNISAGNSLKITSLEFLDRKRLRSFVLQRSFVSAKDLKYLLPMADTLQSLDLTSSINILDVSLVGKLWNLRNLWLGSMRDGVDDSSFLEILHGCNLLESLCIENLPKLTERSLTGLGLLKHLKKLEAAGVSRWNDNCCTSLEKCLELKYLDVKFDRNISADGIRSLLRLPSLNHLELLGIPSFSVNILSEFSSLPAKIVVDNYSPICPFVISPIPAPA